MSTYTVEDVSNHNTSDDIWIIINNDVFDITDFIDEHPGGKQVLLSVGGKDATDFFEELHRPSILDEIAINYKIGSLI